MRVLRAALLACALLAACATSASAKTTWLCRPGMASDPCTPGLSTTAYSPTLAYRGTQRPRADTAPAADCFYVYPTVSDDKSPLSDLSVDPEEKSIALFQAARYSQHCRVYAPMYQQATIQTLFGPGGLSPALRQTGLQDVRAAFRDYLRHDNHGRPFVLVGHSQGSFVLDQLIKQDVDRVASVRRRLLSAILLGGNVLSSDFAHVPPCRRATQLRCVVAFSTFDQPVPPDTRFGRKAPSGARVICTNPAALGGGTAPLDSILPSAPFAPGTTIAAGIGLLGLRLPQAKTTWTRIDGAFVGHCSATRDSTVLQLTPAPGGQRPNPSPDATWGLHLLDANVGLGNLVDTVGRQALVYVARHPPRRATARGAVRPAASGTPRRR